MGPVVNVVNPANEAPVVDEPCLKKQKTGRAGDDLMSTSRIYEYTSAANPHLPPVPVLVHPPSLHESGPSAVIPFDVSESLGCKYKATSPNLLAAFIRINPNDRVESQAVATSQAFYVIRGAGRSHFGFGDIEWAEGDMFVVPATSAASGHTATMDSALYWVSDEPLMEYLGVSPNKDKFEPTVFRREQLLAAVENISHEPGVAHRNRMGVLLGNAATETTTKTLSHVLWSLLNTIAAGDNQRPHRHNSVALDLCVGRAGTAGDGKVYTMMGPELGEDGWVKDPIKMEWVAGGVFITPPGWWHSHHNETGEAAWVLPVQDAGLLTHQRTLDIRFAPSN